MMDIEVGDVVVCVDISPRPGNDWGHMSNLQKLRVGELYRVGAVGLSNLGNPFIIPKGLDLGIMPNGKPRSFLADRFRKVEKASPAFTAQMRSLKGRKQTLKGV